MMMRSVQIRTRAAFVLPRRLFFDKVDRNWDTAWQQKVTPWELGRPSRPLQHYVAAGLVHVPATGGRALVPGCGSGMDCLFLAGKEVGFEHVVGTDISQTAIDICNDNLQKCNDYLLSKKVSFQTANFFEMSAEDNEKFDFIFDYTFFVAIDREMRTDWAKSMAALLRSSKLSDDWMTAPQLLTLIFPVDPTMDATQGPPYASTLDDYADVLVPEGFICSFTEPVTTSVGPRKGKEQVAIWTLIDN